MGGGIDHTGNPAPLHGDDAQTALDLAGVEQGTLECIVNSPIKENEGTQSVFISYLVTTNVCVAALSKGCS
jgi:hypothetical protein